MQISELIQGKRQCPDIVSIYSAAQYTVYTVHQWKYTNTVSIQADQYILPFLTSFDAKFSPFTHLHSRTNEKDV